MYASEKSLDDILRRVFRALLRSSVRIRPSKGRAREITGALLELTNARSRLSRTETKGTVFSCLGELCWYLAKTNSLDFIKYYIPEYRHSSDDRRTVYGAYGPRLFCMRGKYDQLSKVTKILRKKKDSRQAVVQLFDAEDLRKKHRDVPCTCTLQFMLRGNKLHIFTNMRSNDAFKGLPHDVFCFTMIQEVVARTLGVQLGTYKHAVGSLHLYDRDRSKAIQYLKEGWQPNEAMPRMPVGNPWPNVRKLLRVEQKLREDRDYRTRMELPTYWADMARLLAVFANQGRKTAISELKGSMSSSIYDAYIDKRADMHPRKKD